MLRRWGPAASTASLAPPLATPDAELRSRVASGLGIALGATAVFAVGDAIFAPWTPSGCCIR